MISKSYRASALFACSTLMLGLAGCSSNLLEGKKIDYKSAATRQTQNTLEIPPDLTAPAKDERYTVPDGAPRGSATFSAYSSDRAAPVQPAATSSVLPAAEKMRIERAGSQRWLVVQGTPEQLWPVVKEFWLELGFIVNVDRPEIGVMETDWAEDRAKIPQDILRSALGKVIDGVYSTPERDKFRTRFEGGKDSGSVEIYVSHRGMIEVYSTEGKDQTVWQPRPADPELEAEMLRRLMVRLGAQEDKAKQMLASRPVEDRASLQQVAGRSALTLQESFDRAWRRVGLALDRVGFAVEDRDRAKGLYFVRYIDPDRDNQSKKSEGILSKLAFWRSEEKKEMSPDNYRILVKGDGSATTVSVLTREGGEDQSETARRILGLLHGQLK